MHPNPIFHTASAAKNLAFARASGFGVLAISGPDGPLLSHVPFLMNGEGTVCELHLVRSNPIVRQLRDPQPAKIAVAGPHSYISPDWYDLEDQVPTWNYVAVHVSGELRLQPQDRLRDLLDRQSAFFESRLAPKPEWNTGKMTEGVMERMMRQIVPCAMDITGVDGTWKMNQNKPDAARLSAANHVDAFGIGTETRLLAAMMRGAGDENHTKGETE